MGSRKTVAKSRGAGLPPWADSVPPQWGWLRLEDVCLEIVDCPHSTPVFIDSGPYLVARTPDILSGVFRTADARRVTRETYLDRIRRLEPKYGDLLYSREGTYFGIAAEVPSDTKVCLGQRMVLLRPDPLKVTPTFLRFWLNSPLVQSHIHGYRDGSVAERLNLSTIRHLPVALPALAEQAWIARILGTLDDKIELNRHMNQQLDEVARAIFKSWFIDFDPVFAKAEGREPVAMAPETAGLFPESFGDSVLGLVPEGWRVGTVDDLLVLQRGFDLPASSRTPGPYPVMAASGPNGSHNEAMAKGPGVTTGRSGVLGQVYYVHDDFWPLNTSLWVKEFRGATPTYAYQFLRTLDLGHLNAGSAVPTLNRNHVHLRPAVVPPKAVVRAYEEFAAPLFHRAKVNLDQTRTLTELRDALLPRLISGKLRIPDAKEAVEEALA